MDLDYKAILDRVGIVLNVDDKRQIRKIFANDIGVDRASVNRWISRDSIPLTVLYEFSKKHNISFHWLIESVGDKDLFIIDKELLIDVFEIAEEFVETTGVDWDKATMIKYAFLVYEQELNALTSSKESKTKMLELISKVS
ncbi:MAG: bacteriophage CI repressor [Desulfobacterales bacterium]|nr:bacteriophage CI repressor [Desulfobacterales bacterium]